MYYKKKILIGIDSFLSCFLLSMVMVALSSITINCINEFRDFKKIAKMLKLQDVDLMVQIEYAFVHAVIASLLPGYFPY